MDLASASTVADSEQVVENDCTSSLIGQLGKAILQLEALKNTSEDTVQWMEIEEHFYNLDTMLKKKIEELETKEREFEEKEAETRALLADKEAVVVAKEQDLLDRVQELKDAAVAAIDEARENHQPTSSSPVNDVKASKVSSSLGDKNSPEDDFPHKMDENVGVMAVEIKPRPELTQFCEQMDAKGLLNYIINNQKMLHAIREELSVALESATDPAHLVLGSLEGFYLPVDTTQPGDQRDAVLQGMRKTCIMLMESLSALLARADPGADHLLNPETMQQAKAIADEWKPKLANTGIDAANGYSLEAEAFLQLLATFRIASEFDEEELCKLVLAVAHRRQAPELCRSLGLTHKIPGLVESLIQCKRQIDSVRFIHAFQLTQKFPPVPLLKAYLKDLRRNLQEKGEKLGGASDVQNDANSQELVALKSILNCIQEYNLEADYAVDPLQRRLAQLEKLKADKKRGGDSGRRHNQPKKRNRTNGGYRGPGISAVNRLAPPGFGERAPPYMGMMDRYPPHIGQNTYDYHVPSQPAYPQTVYDQRMYYYPQDDAVAPTSYGTAPSSYGGYTGSSSLQPSNQPYM